MIKTINYFVHFHKNFPHARESNWVIPTIYENRPNLIENALCLSQSTPSIRELFKDFEPMDEDKIGYLSQTIAAEYRILKHLKHVDYVGVTGYRRYPHFNYDRTQSVEGFAAAATPENIALITHNNHLKQIHEILSIYDAITISKIHCGGSVKSQFLETQREDIWDHFIASIARTIPEYKRWLGWFDLENHCHFCGPMGLTPLAMFKDYADMYVRVIIDMLKEVQDPFLCLDETAQAKTDRWIGYLAERFYPFFLFVNNVKTYQVPMILLTDPPA